MTREGEGRPPRNIGWIISFADLVTILLTFLVLINGLAAPSPETMALLKGGRVDGDTPMKRERGGDGNLYYADRALMAPAVALATDADRLPPDVAFDQEGIAEAVFQLAAAKPREYRRLSEALRDGVEISRDSRGFAIKWDRALLFPEGSATLVRENALLLDRLAEFLKAVPKPLSVEAHTDPLSPLEGGDGPAAWDLSLARARAVMEYLRGRGVAESRFRLGPFGGARPRTRDITRSYENGRLEIVICR